MSSEDCRQIVEMCLSFSRFSSCDWKQKAIRTAKTLLNDDPYLQARVELREKNLSLLQPGRFNSLLDLTSRIDCNPNPPSPRENAHLGELILCHASELINNQQFAEALDVLTTLTIRTFQMPLPSAQERGVLFQMMLRKGQLHRYQGRFRQAQSMLQEARGCVHISAEQQLRTTVHLAAVYCEQGLCEQAEAIVKGHFDDMAPTLREYGRGIIVRLTLAEVNLMKGLWMIRKMAKGLAWNPMQTSVLRGQTQGPFEEAESLYHGLQETYRKRSNPSKVGQRNHFAILAGLAIISHCRFWLDQTTWEETSGAWYSVEDAAKQCGWSGGHIEMIVKLSFGELYLRRGYTATSRMFVGHAESIRSKISWQWCFVGLGTIWPALVNGWLEYGKLEGMSGIVRP